MGVFFQGRTFGWLCGDLVDSYVALKDHAGRKKADESASVDRERSGIHQTPSGVPRVVHDPFFARRCPLGHRLSSIFRPCRSLNHLPPFFFSQN
jgi:hypothetical protein